MANRTSRHAVPNQPVTDFSGSRPTRPNEEQNEQRYVKLKKRSVLLLLIAICSAVGYVVFVLIANLALPADTPTAIEIIVSLCLIVAFFVAIISGLAALIVRLVAALRR